MIGQGARKRTWTNLKKSLSTSRLSPPIRSGQPPSQRIVCQPMPPKLSSAEMPKKCRAVGTSKSSRNSSPPTSSTIHPSQTALPIATALEVYTAPFEPHSPISTQISHWQTAEGELVTTYKTYHETHKEHSWVWRQPVDESTLKPSTSCECATARSLSIGVWQIFLPYAAARHLAHRNTSVDGPKVAEDRNFGKVGETTPAASFFSQKFAVVLHPNVARPRPLRSWTVFTAGG